MSPHHINKDSSPIMSNEPSSNGSIQGAGVVDLRMKHHQQEFNGFGNFTTTPADQPLPAQSSQSIEKYLNHIESNTQSSAKDVESQESSFVRAGIISNSRQQQQSPNMMTSQGSVENHQMVSPLRTSNTSPNILVHVSPGEHETINSPQQTRNSPPIPVKTMLLEALLPNSNNNAVNSSVPIVQEQNSQEDLLTSMNNALLSPLQDPVVTASGATNGTSSGPLQVSSKGMTTSASHMQQMQALAQQDAAAMQQQAAQQVEQVVAHAQQQVEQVVAQAQQQAAQAVQTAQQQVVHQVVQHAQVGSLDILFPLLEFMQLVVYFYLEERLLIECSNHLFLSIQIFGHLSIILFNVSFWV